MEILSGIPLGSILSPPLFYHFYKSLCDNASDLFMFVNECKLYKLIIDAKDIQILQSDYNVLPNWMDRQSSIKYVNQFPTEEISTLSVLTIS
jgi:hypothetical protein